MVDEIDARVSRSVERIAGADLSSRDGVDRLVREIHDEMRRTSDATEASQYLVRLSQRIYERGQFPQLVQAYFRANFETFDLNRDGYVSATELRSILNSRLIQAATSPFEKQIIQFALVNFQAIAEASNDEFGRETRISARDLDRFPQIFAARNETQLRAQDMLSQFGTASLFARLRPSSHTTGSRIPLVSDADLRRALSGNGNNFSEGERRTIQYMIDHRTEIARMNNDQWGRETKISLRDIQLYAERNRPQSMPTELSNVSTIMEGFGRSPQSQESPRTGAPSTQEICSFVERNFGMLDLNGDRYISRTEVERVLNTPRWRNSLSTSDRRTLEAFSTVIDTMQKAHRDEWWWYKDTRGVTLRDVQSYARHDSFNNRDMPTTPGDHYVRMMVDGREREVLVHIPPNYDGRRNVPQWVFLHSLWSDNREMPEWTSMTRQADEAGAIIVYPNARGWLPEWSPLHLREWTLHNRPTNRTDDLNFVRTIMDTTQRQLAIDPSRVYVVGYSNGGMLAHEVAARMPDRIAAVAIVGSTQCGDLGQAAGRTSVLMMNGTEDPLIPWEGRTWPARLGFSGMRSVDQNVSYWRNATGATVESRPEEAFPGVIRHTYTNQQTGQEVIQYRMVGSGHCWPGARSSMFGPLCRTMDAPSVIGAFFARHSNPNATRVARNPR